MGTLTYYKWDAWELHVSNYLNGPNEFDVYVQFHVVQWCVSSPVERYTGECERKLSMSLDSLLLSLISLLSLFFLSQRHFFRTPESSVLRVFVVAERERIVGLHLQLTFFRSFSQEWENFNFYRLKVLASYSNLSDFLWRGDIYAALIN